MNLGLGNNSALPNLAGQGRLNTPRAHSDLCMQSSHPAQEPMSGTVGAEDAGASGQESLLLRSSRS